MPKPRNTEAPPRKSMDQAPRKSDVSESRFMLAETASSGTQSTAAAHGQPVFEAIPSPVPEPRQAPSADKDDKEVREKEKEKERDKGKEKEKEVITIEDLTLPKSIVTRLTKGVLPPNTQIQANAILAMTKGASVFISHLANAANEITTMANKKTIQPQDVFMALEEIEFGFMREQLEAEYAKFNQIQTTKRSTYRKRVAEETKKRHSAVGGAGADDPDNTMMTMNTTGVQADVSAMDETMASAADDAGHHGDEPPRAKKARMVGGAGDEEEDAPDASDVPDEEDEDEDDEDDAAEEEDEEDEDDAEDAGVEGRDEMEERGGGMDDDEALDRDDSD